MNAHLRQMRVHIIIKFVAKTDTDIHNILQENVRDCRDEDVQDFRPN